MYSITTATKKIAALRKRIRAVQGGTSASKTVSIVLLLVDKAQRDKRPTITSIVSESFPHLKRGVMRDFMSIMEEHRYFRPDRWNKTEYTYTFETGSRIEFFSVDQPGKVRGPRRERLFINEANNISYETFDQLEVRTKECVYLDWNPVSDFWFYDKVQSRSDAETIIVTYKDNEALDSRIVETIEQRRERKGWWKVYGEGQLGEVEGKIYKDWQILDEVPHTARLERYGLDFGYTNDPTAIVAVYKHNQGFIWDEVCFQKGLSNKQIADIFLNQPQALVIADSAEPKSIDEIKSYGVNILPAEKGPDSVRNGIQLVQDQKISVTKRSVNIIKEYRNYLWMTDKDGSVLNVPEHQWSHCFAPETLVLTDSGLREIQSLIGTTGFLYSRSGKLCAYSNVRPTRKDAEVITLRFNDGRALTVTPDHLLLLPSGEWIEAGLLYPSDLIQSAMYDYYQERESTRVYGRGIYALSWAAIFQGLLSWSKIFFASSYVGELPWGNSIRFSCSSQGPQPIEQYHRKLGVETFIRASLGAYDARVQGASTGVGWRNPSSRLEVAWIKRGHKVSQVAWEEVVGRTRTFKENLFSLPQRVQNAVSRIVRSILPSELQNEGPTKKIVGISRGRRAVTFNLEVDGAHCLWADGVIAHNSMDGGRYAMASIVKTPVFKMPEATAPAKGFYGDRDVPF